jgi:outer membrane protein assembly factor BamB
MLIHREGAGLATRGVFERRSRRWFLYTVGRVSALGGMSLLGACQGPATGPARPPTPESTVAPATGVAPTPGPAASPSPAPSQAAAQLEAPATGGADAPAGRPMYQMDPRHTGHSPYAGPRRAVLLRSFDSGSFPTADPAIPRPDIQSSAAIGPDGTIYIGNFPGNLFALQDPGSGDELEVLWRFHPSGATSLHATPAVARDGTVYLGFSPAGAIPGGTGSGPEPSGTFYALRAPSSGIDPRMVWSVDLGPGRPTSAPIVADDGTVYMASGAGRLFAIAPNGTIKWSARAGPVLKGSPALGQDGTVYLPSMDGKLYAVAPPSGSGEGTVRWTFDFGQHLGLIPLVTAEQGPGGVNGIGSGGSPTIGPDGTVYVGANNSNFYAVAPDGQLKWLFEAERELAGIWSTAALSPDASTLYFTANKGGVYALNRADGSLRWQFNVDGSIYSSPALDSQGTLYTGSTVGHLFALDSTNGRLIFDHDVGQQVWSAPAIRPDGSLVVADRTGRVMLFGVG